MARRDVPVRWVLHMDMDAFYASVEQLTRPTLRGRPVLVGGVGPRGTVAGASYEARPYGPHSAMAMAEARRLCPPAVVLPPRFRVYHAVSERVFGMLREITPVVEQVALDEAFAEPGFLAGAEPDGVGRFATDLRDRVRAAVGVTASVGAGSGKQLAKIASGLAKPDGQLVVTPDQQAELLATLPVRKMWGVGPVSEGKLHRIGVHTIGELAALQHSDATALLGQAHGTELHRLAQGVDDHAVAERGESKQVGAETTFETDIVGGDELADAVASMARAAHRRLVSSSRAARTVTVKIRTADFATMSRSETTAQATSDQETLVATARRLTAAAMPNPIPVRLVGVSLSGLADSEQEPLFDNPADRPAEGNTGQVAETDPVAAAQRPPAFARSWQAGDDVRHPDFGHGWVQGAGHGRVSVRFETAASGPGPMRTFDADEAGLRPADSLDSLAW